MYSQLIDSDVYEDGKLIATKGQMYAQTEDCFFDMSNHDVLIRLYRHLILECREQRISSASSIRRMANKLITLHLIEDEVPSTLISSIKGASGK